MTTRIDIPMPLPPCLARRPDSAQCRRRQFGNFRFDLEAIQHFNQLVGEVGREDAPLECDQLITAGRMLRNGRFSAGLPEAVRHHMRRARGVFAMAADPMWDAEPATRSLARMVSDYVSANDDLIPDAEPVIGRLDDAIVIEAACARLSEEIAAYLDFRRLRNVVTGHDDARSGFDRDAWRQARADEARLEAHRRHVRSAGYCPAAAGMFPVY